MSVNFQALRDSIDLTEIARRYTTLNRYLQGPCPLCGGRDRFYIHKGGQRWGCRRCNGKGGDVVDLVSLCERISKVEAAKMLTGDQFVTSSTPARPAAPKEPSPNMLDQDLANEVIERGVKLLPDSPGLAYAESRGLSLKTLARYEVGFDPLRFDPQAKVKRPALIMPWIAADGAVEAVKFRFIDNVGDLRFTSLKGSSPLLFGVHALPAAPVAFVVVEGELNALSLAEAYGREVAVLSIGSKGNQQGLRAACEMYRTRFSGVRVILWLDDENDVITARKTFGGRVVGLKSPDAHDANVILVSHGASGLREFLLPHDTDSFPVELKALRDQANRASSSSGYLAVARLIEALYDKTTDPKIRSELFRLEALAEKNVARAVSAKSASPIDQGSLSFN